MIKVSVISATYRIGGIDVLLEGLAQQTYRRFEVVMVDELWNERANLIYDKAKRLGVGITVLKPEYHGDWGVPSHWNQAIRTASGDLLITTDDYTWYPPDWLQKHVEFAEAASGMDMSVLGCGPTHDVAFPPVRWQLPLMRNHDFNIPIELCWYSTFRFPEDKPICDCLNLQVIREDGGKPFWQWGEYTPKHWAYGNLAIPLDVMLEMDGYDTAYNGAHGFWDNDMSWRLHAAGYRARYLPNNPVYHMYHTSIFTYDHGPPRTEYFEKRKADIQAGNLKLPLPNHLRERRVR